tara:strand:- start:388 stop:573 length:186 start_codon:yes stop_codon:yes gene_type:complete
MDKNYKIEKSVTVTFSYMDMIRLSNGLDKKAQDEEQRLGESMQSTQRLQHYIQEILNDLRD